MATITLEYDIRNSEAKRIIETIISMGNVFKICTQEKINNKKLTLNAIQDVENGNVITCESYDDYLKYTAQYA